MFRFFLFKLITQNQEQCSEKKIAFNNKVGIPKYVFDRIWAAKRITTHTIKAIT